MSRARLAATYLVLGLLSKGIFMTAGFCLYGQILCSSRCIDFASCWCVIYYGIAYAIALRPTSITADIDVIEFPRLYEHIVTIIIIQCGNVYVGRNLWICAIHGSRCAICGSILCTGIHGLRRNLWISIACAIYRSAGSAHRPAAYAASPRSPFEFVCIYNLLPYNTK